MRTVLEIRQGVGRCAQLSVVPSVRIEVRKRRFRLLVALLDLAAIAFSGGGPVSTDEPYRVDVRWPNGVRKKVFCQSHSHALAVKAHLESAVDLTVDEFSSM